MLKKIKRFIAIGYLTIIGIGTVVGIFCWFHHDWLMAIADLLAWIIVLIPVFLTLWALHYLLENEDV
jgi:hypothetical protein